jgi:hypothetical protein
VIIPSRRNLTSPQEPILKEPLYSCFQIKAAEETHAKTINPSPFLSPSNLFQHNRHYVDPASRLNLSATGEESGQDCPPDKSSQGKTQVPGGEKQWDAKCKQEEERQKQAEDKKFKAEVQLPLLPRQLCLHQIKWIQIRPILQSIITSPI